MKSAAVVYVKELERMRWFYAGCFEMESADDADDYCVLESESLTLSLVVVPEHIGATFDISVTPARREDSPIKLAFGVADLGAMRPRVADLGGSVDPANTEWAFRGSIHVDCVDPEGNVIQLVEPIAQTIPDKPR